ncbi:VOC family protein [Jeongeupia sp. HS-3]|uniref:VOC family protein n=1 Tax=Jeongeupia sp. HS-3 TaxID=1009682 RepID=UPI0018A34EFA|nr:VOC family protein [Jeongeupia sp. HS-3]BCL76359.1 VOC family protein [Jeongeupia sp. HS-3]
MQVQPYLFFNGRCGEALAFYQSALGANVSMLMHFKDAPPDAHMDCDTAGWGDKVMHANFSIGETQLMASDGMGQNAPTTMSGCAMSIGTKDMAEGQRLFDALAAGGQVQMPYQPTFWAKGFGMLTDRFGINWMINCEV